MRKDLRKRLEKALNTLEEPGGSTIRSIIKVINKEAPTLSVRTVLEALQEGLNEGFLCMYNGRFKLKQQVQKKKHTDKENRKENTKKKRPSGKTNKRDGGEFDDASDSFSSEEEGDDEGRFESTANVSPSRQLVRKRVPDYHTSRRKHDRSSRQYNTRRKSHGRYMSNQELMQRKRMHRRQERHERQGGEPGKSDDSVLDLTPEKPRKPTTERPDVKKQRGPRCTSLKKDVRMPSKVHIPYVPPSIPQRNNTFNDLLRRSPEPVNGPLFDDILNTDNLGCFGTYA